MSKIIEVTDLLINQDDLPSLFLKNLEDGNVHLPSPIVAVVEHIKTESRKIIFDINTSEGKQGIKSLAANIAKAKVAIDKAGKSKKDELSVDIKIIDGLRNLAKKELQELQDEIRAPLTELENAEKARKADLEKRLEWLSSFGNMTMTSIELNNHIEEISELPITEAEWGEYRADASEAKDSTLIRLKSYYEQVKQQEDEKAELLKLRAVAAEYERLEAERQAADKARLAAEAEAERKAEQVRQDHQRQLELQAYEAEQALKAEKKRIADLEAAKLLAEQQAENDRQLELQRQQDEADLLQREADERKKDKELREAIKNKVLMKLIDNNVPQVHGRKVIKLILDGKIPEFAELISLV